jgi:protein-S-isoprenylcysteine O-methyltransferase Ste14
VTSDIEPVRSQGAAWDANVIRSAWRSRRRGVVQRALITLVPAAILGWLAFTQVNAAIRGVVLLAASPSWPVAVEVAREALYGSFILGAAVVLATSKDARVRDGRGWVVVASLTASFLLLGASFLPAGPLVWSPSTGVTEVGLAITVFGAALALAAFLSLRANFSIVPEARSLVVTGPYRWIRHPMYFAEILMIAGFAVSGLRLTSLLGALSVLGLQIYRIRVEDRLLSTTFRSAHQEFVSRTRYRLLPLVW